MAITVNLRYTGKDGNARKFAEEMTTSGTVAAIRAEAGNLRYEYYQSFDDPETVLLIDSWTELWLIALMAVGSFLTHG